MNDQSTNAGSMNIAPTEDLIVHRIERHIQPVKVTITVPPGTTSEQKAKWAREAVEQGCGEETGEMEYHSTEDPAENWPVYDSNNQQIS